MRSKITIAGIALLAALALACGSGGDNDPPTGTIPGDTSADGSNGSENTETDLKSTVTFADGIAVSLKDLKRGTSSEYASPGNAPMVTFKVSVTNGSAKDLDLSLVSVKCAVGADGDQADIVIDPTNGLDITISGAVKTGSTKSGKFGCPIADNETKIQIEVSLNDDLSRSPAVFAGKLSK